MLLVAGAEIERYGCRNVAQRIRHVHFVLARVGAVHVLYFQTDRVCATVGATRAQFVLEALGLDELGVALEPLYGGRRRCLDLAEEHEFAAVVLLPQRRLD